MADVVTLVNDIRGSIGGDYASRIPEATRENILAVGNTILRYEAHQNMFLSELLNRIGRTVIEHLDTMEDPYAIFKSERLEYGDTIQKIYVDVFESKSFEGTATEDPASMLKVEKGTIHVEYTSVDRRIFYKVTISIPELKEAFLTVDKLTDFVKAMTDGMARSFDLDRYIMLSHTLRKHASYVLQGVEYSTTSLNQNALIVPESVAKYNLTTKEVEWTTTGAKEFLKLLKKVSGSLKFYHKLDYYQLDDGDVAPATDASDVDADTIKTIKAVRTPRESQVIALEVNTMADIDVDALAVLFNLEKAEMETRKIELENGVLGMAISQDETETSADLYIGGFIANKDGVVRGTSFEAEDSFKNPEHQYINYWKHFWGYQAVSKFKDFVPIVFIAYTPTSNSEQVEGD